MNHCQKMVAFLDCPFLYLLVAGKYYDISLGFASPLPRFNRLKMLGFCDVRL